MITKSENDFKKFYEIWNNEGNEILAYFNFLHGLSQTTSGLAWKRFASLKTQFFNL